MKRSLILSAFALLLAACGEGDPYNSSVQSTTGSNRGRLATFVKAADGTLYSTACLQQKGQAIASGDSQAGHECRVDQLNEDQVRGMRGAFSSSYFYYVSPLNYYGGASTNFCASYFGYSWNGCYSWLGYQPSQYQSSYYYPECNTQCVTTMQYPPTTSCPTAPSYCQSSSKWSNYSWYNNWNNWNWLVLYY